MTAVRQIAETVAVCDVDPSTLDRATHERLAAFTQAALAEVGVNTSPRWDEHRTYHVFPGTRWEDARFQRARLLAFQTFNIPHHMEPYRRGLFGGQTEAVS